MNVAPKSTAELVTQFLAVPPNKVELGGENNFRYQDAYQELDYLIGTGSHDAVIAHIDSLKETHGDIISIKSKFSYVSAIREARRSEGIIFAHKLKAATDAVDYEQPVVDLNIENLRNSTLFLSSTQTREQIVEGLFPSGNYFLHSTDTDSILSIFSDGRIKATIGFESPDDRAEKSMGGTFGVSGNYNHVSNILGSPRHLAGFIADPQVVLQNQGGYFAPPSKACWNEVQYFPANEDPLHIMQLRDAETHMEITRVVFEEAGLYHAIVTGDHSVFEAFPPEEIHNIRTSYRNSMQILKSNPNILTRAYRLGINGKFRFTEMLGADDENVTPFSVLVAAAAEGAFGDDIASSLKLHGTDNLDINLMLTNLALR